MAFQLTPPATAAATDAKNGNFEKAAGFINFYLPSASGGNKKLVSLGLKMSNESEKYLFELLKKDPEVGLKLIMNNLSATFQEVKAGNGFALG